MARINNSTTEAGFRRLAVSVLMSALRDARFRIDPKDEHHDFGIKRLFRDLSDRYVSAPRHDDTKGAREFLCDEGHPMRSFWLKWVDMPEDDFIKVCRRLLAQTEAWEAQAQMHEEATKEATRAKEPRTRPYSRSPYVTTRHWGKILDTRDS